MPDLPTRLDLFSIGRDFVRGRAKKIDPRVIDIAGSDANLMVGSTSFMAAHVTNQLGGSMARMYLDGCEGEDLDRWSWDRYQLLRKGASPARGSVQFNRPTSLLGGGSIPVGTKISTLTGIEYITTTAATFGALGLTATANVRATQAGKVTQVSEGALAKFSQPQLIFDQTILINNPAGTAGGEEKEDDDLFKGRIRNFWRNARRGTLGAIELGALEVPGVVSARTIEALTQDGQPARVVNLYIGDSTGVASVALAADVRVNLEDWRAGGIAVLIYTSAPLFVEIALDLTFRANVDTLTLTDNIRSAMSEFVNTLPVNGTLYRGQIYSVLQRYEADGLIPRQESIVEPAGDLVPNVGQTIRTTPQNITVAI